MRYLFAFTIALCLTYTANAQVHINLNFNIGNQPIWGPTGSDYAEYYYLPDIDVYYSVPLHRFYYYEGARWIYSSNLPPRYHDYDLYKSYKVVINEPRPWQHNQEYMEKYYSYRDRHDQETIRDSRDPKYFVNEHHPEHDKWVEEHGHDNGKHKVWYKEKRKEEDHHKGRREHDDG